MPIELSPEVVEFLDHSNRIEGVHDERSLEQAKEAWIFLTGIKDLTIGAILKTHKILMLNQNLYPHEKGYFRKVPVYIGGHEAIPAMLIKENLESWLGDVDTSIRIPGEDGHHIKLDHIEYERIHPFVDGNGRTGRLFMNWERVRAGLPILIIHEGEEQQEYYKWFIKENGHQG